MRTTLKRGIGRVAVVNGDGRAVLPPGALSPVTTYRRPERKRGAAANGRDDPVRARRRVPGAARSGSPAAPTCGSSRASTRRRRTVSQGGREAPRRRRCPNKPSDALVIGYDHRPEDGNAPSRSDTLMLLRTDPTNDDDLDALVPARPDRQDHCPDGRTATDRINAAYAYCGPEGSLETVRQLTGLPIHFLIARQLRRLPGDRRQARRRLARHRPPLPQSRGRRLRHDQPLAGLPAAEGLAGARLRPLPAHRLRPLPARPPAAVREGDEAGREARVGRPEERLRGRERDDERTCRSGAAGGRGISPTRLTIYARFAYEHARRATSSRSRSAG